MKHLLIGLCLLVFSFAVVQDVEAFELRNIRFTSATWDGDCFTLTGMVDLYSDEGELIASDMTFRLESSGCVGNNGNNLSSENANVTKLTQSDELSIEKLIKGESMAAVKDVVIFPNPSNDGILNVEIPVNRVVKNVQLVELSGKSVLRIPQGQFEGNTAELNVSNLSNGQYVFIVNFADGTTSDVKLTLNK